MDLCLQRYAHFSCHDCLRECGVELLANHDDLLRLSGGPAQVDRADRTRGVTRVVIDR
jgi:hypothetical protein